MKRTLAALFGIGCLAAAVAQTSAPTTNDGLPPVQPPPDLDTSPAKSVPALAPEPAPTRANSNAPVVPLANSDAEAQAAEIAAQQAAAERAKSLAQPDFTTTSGDKKPLDSPGLPPDVQRAAEATELPVVTVRQNGNERVEEYRKKGVLYFVRVVPEAGPPRYYVDRPSNIPPDLSQISGPSGVVQPVYYKLFDWH